jgi:toxin ParE1/3/4
MIPIVKSPQYERDMAEIWQYIAQHNPAAADRVVRAIETTIELLSEFPGIGTPCPHLAPGLRRTLWREYLIYYRVRENKVEIVRALHGRRNITPAQFGD